ncbi:MAG: Co2+/Mg2+ efflux protein ApaG [Bacteroidetes bacterium]|nr:Co2+/Mg2+ efflux protein ApaG [Bacteroidota bacterium]MBV6461568.1 Protein ApaG [Flavobacteriales bacterium]WKZ74049.1 MAG: Co2+/Mg2+ efflux protein ApaG [Vicingaceae bacterium]MCL4817182.1 Co2+/Mg2+ efflux protein ApaG [Flavobacteriales bacterium]NOG95863.1 Co2+/Mg2+ efflux protein ApaG [Bacteroidota bacterium]
MIVTETTQGIRITVQARYLDEESKPSEGFFIFSYHIIIENNTPDAVQLLKRHWHIFDSSGEYNQVAGNGVVGEQPIIAPGEEYEYHSYCELTTPIGRMWGTYTFENKSDHRVIEAKIPEFHLEAPFVMN